MSKIENYDLPYLTKDEIIKMKEAYLKTVKNYLTNVNDFDQEQYYYSFFNDYRFEIKRREIEKDRENYEHIGDALDDFEKGQEEIGFNNITAGRYGLKYGIYTKKELEEIQDNHYTNFKEGIKESATSLLPEFAAYKKYMDGRGIFDKFFGFFSGKNKRIKDTYERMTITLGGLGISKKQAETVANIINSDNDVKDIDFAAISTKGYLMGKEDVKRYDTERADRLKKERENREIKANDRAEKLAQQKAKRERFMQNIEKEFAAENGQNIVEGQEKIVEGKEKIVEDVLE